MLRVNDFSRCSAATPSRKRSRLSRAYAREGKQHKSSGVSRSRVRVHIGPCTLGYPVVGRSSSGRMMLLPYSFCTPNIARVSVEVFTASRIA